MGCLNIRIFLFIPIRQTINNINTAVTTKLNKIYRCCCSSSEYGLKDKLGRMINFLTLTDTREAKIYATASFST